VIKVNFPGVRADMSLNARLHWAVRARKARELKEVVGWMLKGRKPPVMPMVIHLTRISPRLMDDDNSVGALKNFRDAVAEWIGIDDGKLNWQYRQRKGSWSVEMMIEEEGDDARDRG
jgi:hypothetical protein